MTARKWVRSGHWQADRIDSVPESRRAEGDWIRGPVHVTLVVVVALGDRRSAHRRALGWESVVRLYESQSLESEVLLPAAEHYANAIEQVTGEDEGRAACHAIGLGFALRRLEEAGAAAAPLPEGLVPPALGDPVSQVTDAAARLSAPLGLRLEDEPGALAELFAPGFDDWRQLARRCRQTAAAASLQRRRVLLALSGSAPEPEAAPALVDYERAFRFGYLVACLERATVRPARPPAAPADLLERVDDLLGRGAGLYAMRDTEVALVVGVVHGMGLEPAPADEKDAVISAARAGFALRAAEEAAGLAEVKLPALTDALALAEARDLTLLHWDAAQALAWELADSHDGPPRPDGHGATRSRLLAALDGEPAGAERACRYGYALRCAEGSLPHDPDRWLADG